MPLERRAAGKAESLGRRGVAAHDAPSRRLDQNPIRRRLRRPLRTDRIVASLSGLEYHKPNVIPRKLDEEKQKAFIEGYEKLLNSLGDDEAFA